MTIVNCPANCGGAINTAAAISCENCGARLDTTDIPYAHPERCTARTKGPDSWGCHKRKGHTTGNGGHWCSTHQDCGYRSAEGTYCGKPAGHDNNVHEPPNESAPSVRELLEQALEVIEQAERYGAGNWSLLVMRIRAHLGDKT